MRRVCYTAIGQNPDMRTVDEFRFNAGEDAEELRDRQLIVAEVLTRFAGKVGEVSFLGSVVFVRHLPLTPVEQASVGEMIEDNGYEAIDPSLRTGGEKPLVFAVH